MARDTTTANRRQKGGTPGSPGGSGRRTALILAAITGAALLAIAGVAVLVAGGSGADSYTPNDEGLIETGASAPAFTAQTVDGSGNVSVGGGGDGQPTLLVFFATWCPHCQNEAPIVSDLADQNDDLRVVMAGIDGQDNPQKVQEFAQSYGIEGPAVYEPSLGQRYQVTGYPTVYVLNGSGKVVAANSGETPRGVLEDWVELALGATGQEG